MLIVMTFGSMPDDVFANNACGVGLRCTRISVKFRARRFPVRM
jgi:hypothetical protein